LDRQRIDKWLWHARVVRTRAAAASLASSGHVRVNGQRIEAASRAVKAGDIITVALDRTVRVLEVKGFAERRGSAEHGLALYDDLSEPAPAAPVPMPGGPVHQAGAGRPTKRDRRAIERLRWEEN
jgi:ribosome-associated heat shock protein Hsp15